MFGIAATGLVTGVNLYQAIEHRGGDESCGKLMTQCVGGNDPKAHCLAK